MKGSARQWSLLAIATLFPLVIAVPSTAAAAPTCFGRRASIVGTDGNDILTGTADRDVIAALRGDDQIAGMGGNDLICAGSGVDIVAAGEGSDQVSGGPGVDLLQGDSGRDHLYGNGSIDSLLGGAGHDFLDGGRSSDILQGGSGRDRLDGGRGRADIASYTDATSGVDADLARGTATGQGLDRFSNIDGLFGSRYDDLLTGDGGANVFFGSPGNDALVGGAGFDLVSYVTPLDLGDYSAASEVSLASGRAVKGHGYDSLARFEGAMGGSHLIGNSGANLLIGLPETKVNGGRGKDLIIGGWHLHGGGGDDRLLAIGPQTTFMDGGSGNDYMHGGGYTNVLTYQTAPGGVEVNLPAHTATGQGRDTVRGRINMVVGSDYNDRIIATGWTHDIDGGKGNDFIDKTRGRGNVYGSEGNDVIVGNGTLDGGAGNDEITGGPDNDLLVGYSGNDVLSGGGGNDLILPDMAIGGATAGTGNDTIDGGPGEDNVDFGNAPAPMTVDLVAGTAQGEGTDTLSNVEDIGGSYSHPNTIRGDASDNTLWGGIADDTLSGAGGNDTLMGLDGIDTLDGGSGTDVCMEGEHLAGCEATSPGAVPPSPGTTSSLSPTEWTHSEKERAAPPLQRPDASTSGVDVARPSVIRLNLWVRTVTRLTDLLRG